MNAIEIDTSQWEKAVADLIKRTDPDVLAGIMADEVFTQSQVTVPVDTGELKASGRKERSGKGEAEVIYEADHAVVVEFGTSRMAARPYLRNAMNAERIRRALEDQING